MASKPPPSESLAAWLAERRWFGGKRRRIAGIDVEDSVDLDCATLHVLRVTLDDGEIQRYAVPLSPGATPADALDDPRFVRRLLRLTREESHVAGRAGAVIGHRSRAFVDALGSEPAVRRIGGEQSNTSIVIGDALILKHFRRLAAGDNPERLRSESSFAQLCGVAPIPASSGRTVRHRLNRAGARQANRALFLIVLVRMFRDHRTKAYVARRTSEGLSKPEVIRCLKRYVAREIFNLLPRRQEA